MIRKVSGGCSGKPNKKVKSCDDANYSIKGACEGKDIKSADYPYDDELDFSDWSFDEMAQFIVSNFDSIAGQGVDTLYNPPGDEYEETLVFDQDMVDETQPALEEFLNEHTDWDMRKIEDFWYYLDDYLTMNYDSYAPGVEVQESVECSTDGEDVTSSAATDIDWEDLNGTEQMAADEALSELENGADNISDIVWAAVNKYNEANGFDDYESEDFYGEEADYNKVLRYVDQARKEDITSSVDIFASYAIVDSNVKDRIKDQRSKGFTEVYSKGSLNYYFSINNPEYIAKFSKKGSDPAVYRQTVTLKNPETGEFSTVGQYYVETYRDGKERKQKISNDEYYAISEACANTYAEEVESELLEKIKAFNPSEFRSIEEFERWKKSMNQENPYTGYDIASTYDVDFDAMQSQVEEALNEDGWCIVTVLDDEYVKHNPKERSRISQNGYTKGDAIDMASWKNRQLSPYINWGHAWSEKAMSEADAAEFLKRRNAEEDRIANGNSLEDVESCDSITAAEDFENGDYFVALAPKIEDEIDARGYNSICSPVGDHLEVLLFRPDDDDYEDVIYTYTIDIEDIEPNLDDVNGDAETIADDAVYECETFGEGPGSYTEIDSKEVVDADGTIADYTMYLNDNDGTYFFMFGDKDADEPDPDYADWECETEEEAYEWFDSYEGPGSEE